MSKSNKAVKHESKFAKCVKAPIRILCKARDFYVKSLTDCSGRMNYGSAVGCPTGPVNIMPRSFSTSSSRRSYNDEDLRELIRAASQRGLREKLEMEILEHRKASKLPRSFTVGIGKIDEDKACEFEDDLKAEPDKLYPRSKSYAVTKRTTLYS